MQIWYGGCHDSEQVISRTWNVSWTNISGSIPDNWLSFLDLNAWQLNFYELLVMTLYCEIPWFWSFSSFLTLCKRKQSVNLILFWLKLNCWILQVFYTVLYCLKITFLLVGLYISMILVGSLCRVMSVVCYCSWITDLHCEIAQLLQS